MKDAAVLIQRHYRGFEVRKKFVKGGVEAVSPTKDRCRDRCSPSPATPPSPELEDRTLINPVVVTVTFPDEKKMEIRANKGTLIIEIKNMIGSHLVFRPDLLLLKSDTWEVDDYSNLKSLLEYPFTTSTLQLEVVSKDPKHLPLPPLKNPKRISFVSVDVPGAPTRALNVEVVRDFRRKFFLGGYRSKITGLEYHHAAAQTPKPVKGRLKEGTRFHRETQTAEMVDADVDTPEETSTQMTKIGAYVTIGKDRIMYAQMPYVTADEYHAMLVTKAIVLQKYWRRWLAKRRVARILAWVQERRAEVTGVKERRLKLKEERQRNEFDRRMHPRTKADFDLQFKALEKWRQNEYQEIDATLEGGQRKAELCHLLDQEAQMINSIGKHQNEAGRLAKEAKIKKFLSKTAASKVWRGSDGTKTFVDTPNVLKARHLKHLYESLCLKNISIDERLDILTSLKETISAVKAPKKVKGVMGKLLNNTRLLAELHDLINRECMLLSRGLMLNELDGLRSRINIIFMEFIRDPQFNPEAAMHHTVPRDPTMLRGATLMCPSCLTYRPYKDFHIVSTSNSQGRCKPCIKADNDAHTRIDFGFYGLLLKRLRDAEDAADDDSRICHLLRETDIMYLIDTVWNTRSALSKHDDVYDLILVRWNKVEEWSPWNCVLLTKEEADAHEKLEDPNQAYDELFLKKIAQKHNTARNHFIRLPWMVKYIKSKTTKKAKERQRKEISRAPEPKQCRLKVNSKTGKKILVHEACCEHKHRSQITDSFVITAIGLGKSMEIDSESYGEKREASKESPTVETSC